MHRAAVALLGAALAASPGLAQQAVDVQAEIERSDGLSLWVQSPVLTVDSTQLFALSALGRRIQRDIETAGAALQAQNDRIANELEIEERALTEQRQSLSPEEFRALADAFDAKAERIRQERAAELRALNERLDAERRSFERAILPVLEQIMVEAGAAIILERGDVLLSSRAIDVTDLAIRRIDAATEVSSDE